MLAKNSDFENQLNIIKSLPLNELENEAKYFGYDLNIVRNIFNELKNLISKKVTAFKNRVEEVLEIANRFYSND